MRDVGLLDPNALAMCLAAVGLLLVLLWRSRVHAARWRSLTPTRVITYRGTFIAALMVPLLLIFALTRPYWGTQDVELKRSGVDYMLVVDVSQSMLTRDTPPSRVELAKRKIRDLVDILSHNGVGTRFGITLFAGDAYLFCPLTTDVAVVRQFVEYISPSMVTSLGSNMEAGVSVALERFEMSHTENGRLLLLTDGEDDAASATRIVRTLQEKRVAADVLGIGTPDGRPIELEKGTFLRDNRGNVVISKLSENTLQAIATQSGGRYFRATLDDSDVQNLSHTIINTHGKGGTPQKLKNYNELGPFMALAALVMMIVWARLANNSLLLRSIILSLALSAFDPVYAQDETPMPTQRSGYEAYTLYNQGDYKGAVHAFEQALKEAPDDVALKQGLASALFRIGDYARAQKIFGEVANETKSGREFFENSYNEGNAHLQQKHFKDAIDAYSRALRVKPEDAAALHNRELARALLEEEQKQRSATPTPTPTVSPKSSPAPSPSPQGSPSPQPTADPSASPEGSPSAGPNGSPSPDPKASSSAGSSQTPGATPSVAPADSPQSQPTQQGDGSPEPDQTAANDHASTPKPSEERLKESASNNDRPDVEPSVGGEQQAEVIPSPVGTQNPLSSGEAEAWLQSLPDSPLLLRRQRGYARRGGQTW